MWHFDINLDIYSPEMCRRIFAVSHKKRVETARSFRTITHYTLGEEWYTPNSKGEIKNFDYYTFLTAQDVEMFIAELAIKLNSQQQYVLMRAAEVYSTRITEAYKPTARQIEQEKKKLEQQLHSTAKQKKPLTICREEFK